MDEQVRSTLGTGLPAAAAATVLGTAAAGRAEELLSGLRAAHAAGGPSLSGIGWSRTPAAALEEAVAIAVVAFGLATAAWYLLSVIVVVACGTAAALGARWRQGERALERWGAPALRQAAAVVVGLAMSSGATAAGAAPTNSPLPDDLRWAPSGTTTGVVPDTHPRWRSPRVHAAAGDGAPSLSRTAPQVGGGEGHRVQAGDSLWAIASRAIERRGDMPTTVAVAREWPRWYAANRDVVGPDPDVIHPGQMLRPPNEGDTP